MRKYLKDYSCNTAFILREPASKCLVVLLFLCAVELIFGLKLWQEVWHGGNPRAWDGSGHFAVAQLYSQSIFPDTLGWTHAYFGGMPFPNFYPPGFHWLVALLQHTGLSLGASFKLVLCFSVLLIPPAIWALGYSISGGRRLVAAGASLASLPLLLDSRFLLGSPAGLDYFSTFQIGLYTQPLGFIFLLAWYVSYHRPPTRVRLSWQIVASSLLLVLTFLTNFFNAVTAALFVATIVVDDLAVLKRVTKERRTDAKRTLTFHLTVPLVGLCLSLFWLVPMLGQYEFFVTRPQTGGFNPLFTPVVWGWYLLSLAGGIVWLRQQARQARSYLAACVILFSAVLFASTLAPGWFPFQAPRFLSTLTFLLTVPVGYLLAASFRGFAKLLGEVKRVSSPLSLRRVRYTFGTALVAILLFSLTSPGPRWAFAFYAEGQRSDVDEVLAFARQRRDGRYLVEVINPHLTPAYAEASFDARALNSYLGAQGNETVSGVFHEASPSSLFTLPTVNAFSNYPDSFGISSVLSDDLDFSSQPLATHAERARRLGVKYLVIRTPAMKERVAKELDVGSQHRFGWWSVFELREQPLPFARTLAYKPALVVSTFTLKARRRNEWGYTRLAEEQFSNNWFDVLLARSEERSIDRLKDLDNFGALILDTYDCGDCEAAFELLKNYAQGRALVLLSSKAPLFQRISNSKAEFPKAEFIDRPDEPSGEVIESLTPSFNYNSSQVRRAWGNIRQVLDRDKVPTSSDSIQVAYSIEGEKIHLAPGTVTRGDGLPVLVSMTYHPGWRREDRDRVYAATPFFTLTFVRESASLVYGRSWFELAALWASAVTLILLCGFTIRLVCRRRKGLHVGENSN